MASSLYVHIPFCAHICGYCDFTKVIYNEEWAFSYTKSLLKQLKETKIEGKLKTIYVGGGTPSSLPSSLLEEILKELQPLLGKDYEFSFEGNPENLNEEKLLLLKKYGVNRLSIGIQSSKNKYLNLMGRAHSFEEGKKAVELAKRTGFKNISIDLIYGLPNETLEDHQEDIDNILLLGTPHISTYCLSVPSGTAWKNKGYEEMDDNLAASQYELILKCLREKGFRRYEVSNFALEGYESKHNLVYWKDEEYYAVGLGASGFTNGERFTFTKNLTSYINNDYEGERERLTRKDMVEEYFLTNLRLEEGFKKMDFMEKFGIEEFADYIPHIEYLKKQGLIEETDDSIFATDKGILLLDRVLLELFE